MAITIKQALDNLRKLERQDNFKKQGQVAPQVNCDIIQEFINAIGSAIRLERYSELERIVKYVNEVE